MDAGSIGTAALFATLLVPVVSLIKRPTWSTQVKQLVGLAAALVAAFAAGAVNGELGSWADVVAYFGTARLVAETLYTQYFSNTTANAKLEAVGG